MYIYKAGVVGGGTMGADIAQVITYSGLPVVVHDVNAEAAARAATRARAIYEDRVAKGKMSQHDVEQKLMLLSTTTDLAELADCDIVIEAVPEDMRVKREVFQALDTVLPESAILASNTSALSISELGAATRRPDKVIGLHFFQPAYAMKLVEVVPGLDTSEDTIADATGFVEGLRKIAVRVKECPGFLVNRLLMPYLNESAMIVQEGAATPRQVDDALVAWGMPMGPFTLTDMLGIDISVKVAHYLHEEYGERFRPARLIDLMWEKGRRGAASGGGFYDADGGFEGIAPLVAQIQKETGISGTPFSIERILYLLVNEAAICLEENVVAAHELDIAMMAGTGMPKGPLAYADEVGLDRVLEGLLQFETTLGPRFHPCPFLRRKVRAGHLGVQAGRGFLAAALEGV
jgi:3-hydroxyacyl-CoA dehydrogenase